MKAAAKKGRRRVLIGVVKRRQEELRLLTRWVLVSPDMMFDLIMEARNRGSLLHIMFLPNSERLLRITDKTYGAVTMRHDSRLNGLSFVIRKCE
jgi:hypothetical protein